MAEQISNLPNPYVWNAPESANPPIAPTCRYGHGALVREEGLWTYTGVMFARIKRADGVEVVDMQHRGTGFAALLFRCPTCRYLETFDLDLGKLGI